MLNSQAKGWPECGCSATNEFLEAVPVSAGFGEKEGASLAGLKSTGPGGYGDGQGFNVQ